MGRGLYPKREKGGLTLMPEKKSAEANKVFFQRPRSSFLPTGEAAPGFFGKRHALSQPPKRINQKRLDGSWGHAPVHRSSSRAIIPKR